MNKKLIACICICVLSLTGCGYNQYKVPALTDFGLPSDEIIKEYKVDKEWWKSYNDPQLNELLSIAHTNNFKIQSALIALRRAFITIKLDEGNFIPTASPIATGIEGTRNLGFSAKPDPFSTYLSSGLSLDLSFWHSIPTLEASKWMAKASAEDLESVRLAITFGLIDAYFTLMYHYNLYDLQEENTIFLEQVLQTAKYKQQLGRVDGLEPLTAQQALNLAQEKVIQTRTNINNTLALIRDFLNVDHTKELNIKQIDIIEQKAIEVDLDVPLETLALRPDIRSAEYRAYSALYKLKRAHRTWVPSVSIGSSIASNGSFGSSGSGSTQLMNPASFTLGGALNVSLPALSWWNIKWDVKNAETQIEESLFSFTSTINQALNQIQALYYGYQNEKLIFDLAKKRTIIDSGIFKYRENRYNEGRDDLKTWLEANTNTNNSLENFVFAKLQLIRIENFVFQAMGGMINKKDDSDNANNIKTTDMSEKNTVSKK